MNIFGISWKNIRVKPLSTLLSLILFVLGVGLISLLLLVNEQLADKFERSQGGVNLVVGAKGSPLQLILSGIYHIDNPTGNITLKEARPFLNPQHPLLRMTVPLSLGDSYRNFRIVGTTHDYLDVYGAKLRSGELWKKDFEATMGARVARELDLEIGDEFSSAHGFGETLTDHDEHAFKVVSILEPSGTVLDQLILTNLSSIWESHSEPGDTPPAEDTSAAGEDHADHDHDEHKDHDHDEGIYTTAGLFEKSSEKEDAEITSLLLFFKNETDFRALSMGRGINDNTDMQAASPAYQTARLFEMMGVGEKALRALALIIVIVSGLSVFISLYSSLKDRRYELAIMRVMGASRNKLFFLVIIEGLIIAVLGFLVGIIISHLAMEVLARYMQDAYQYSFTGKMFLKEEFLLLIAALVVGFLAAVIPAIQASNTDISETLATN